MSDLLKKYDQNLNFDFEKFLTGSGLASMVLVSLLTNKEVEGQTRNNAGSRTGLDMGSSLWAYKNQPKTQETLAEMKLSAEEALEWMINEGIASDVEVQAYDASDDKAKLTIKIFKSADNRFKSLWDEATGDNIKINPYGNELEVQFI